MTASEYLFSFKGRINRAKLWLFVLIVFGIEVVLFGLCTAVFGVSALGAMTGHPGSLLVGGAIGIAVVLLVMLIMLALFIAGLALLTRRLHDRDKSAMWLLVFYALPLLLNIVAVALTPNPAETGSSAGGSAITMILSLVALGVVIWGFVELYCLRGTVGDNRYGPDPLAKAA